MTYPSAFTIAAMTSRATCQTMLLSVVYHFQRGVLVALHQRRISPLHKPRVVLQAVSLYDAPGCPAVFARHGLSVSAAMAWNTKANQVLGIIVCGVAVFVVNVQTPDLAAAFTF